MRKPYGGRFAGCGPVVAGVARLPEGMADSDLQGAPAISVQGEDWLEVVSRQVSALRFGSVEITVHEGRVVQVETSTKVRFDKPR